MGKPGAGRRAPAFLKLSLSVNVCWVMRACTYVPRIEAIIN